MTQAIRVITLVVCLVGVAAGLATAQTMWPETAAAAVPADLAVPEGNELYLKAFALGTQNYICLPAIGGVAWKFLGPQATLYQSFDGEPRQQITTHFLSVDAGAIPTARPTWQHSFDSSRVWARVVAASTDPAYVQSGAIPWLLLAAAATAPGTEGGLALANTTFIQRVNTSGGVAPASGCNKRGDIGTVALVPYTTDYFFFRAERVQ